MNFSQSDFSEILVHVHKAKEGIPVKEQFSLFSLYPEFKESPSGLPLDYVLKYIVYMYDINSPLRSINDLMTRKAQAAKLAGFEDNNGRWSEVVVNMFYCNYSAITAMIIRYARVQQNQDWLVLVAYEEKLSKALKNLINDEENEKTKDQLAAITTLRSDIASLMKNISNDDNTKQLHIDISNHIDSEICKLKVEDIAHAMASGENPIEKYNPYGSTKKKSKKSDI